VLEKEKEKKQQEKKSKKSKNPKSMDEKPKKSSEKSEKEKTAGEFSSHKSSLELCNNSKTRPVSDLRSLPESLLDVTIIWNEDGLQKIGATKRDKCDRGLIHNELNATLKSKVL
jgi:hypothetical protein